MDRASGFGPEGWGFDSLAMCHNHHLLISNLHFMDGKTKAIVAHITFVGLIVSLIINNDEKDELASFYNRQQLGLTLTMIALGIGLSILGTIFAFIPIIGWIISMLLGLVWFVAAIAGIVFWIVSLIGALEGTPKLIPLVGPFYQDLFKSL
jgi:uncharacterized membrane protein